MQDEGICSNAFKVKKQMLILSIFVVLWCQNNSMIQIKK